MGAGFDHQPSVCCLQARRYGASILAHVFGMRSAEVCLKRQAWSQYEQELGMLTQPLSAGVLALYLLGCADLQHQQPYCTYSTHRLATPLLCTDCLHCF